jgi:hypothetical protein
MFAEYELSLKDIMSVGCATNLKFLRLLKQLRLRLSFFLVRIECKFKCACPQVVNTEDVSMSWLLFSVLTDEFLV